MFLDFYANNWKKILNVALAVLTAYLIFKAFGYLTNVLASLVVGLIIFIMFEPIALFLQRRGMRKIIATTVAVTIVGLILTGIMVTVGLIIASQIITFVDTLPLYVKKAQYLLDYGTKFIVTHIDMVPKDLIEKGKENIGTILTKASKMGGDAVLGIFSTISTITKIVVNVGLGSIFAFLLSADYERLRFVGELHTPKPIKKAYDFIKENIVKGLVAYVKAQLILIGITFVVVLIALFFLKVDNFFVIALVAAIFDVLPLLGVSTLLVPWVIYLFITGDTNLALSVGVLWLVVVGLRQILEPKVTGNSIGVGAFEMFVTMILCISFFGVIGLFIAPIAVVTFKALWKEGYFKTWFTIKEEKNLQNEEKSL